MAEHVLIAPLGLSPGAVSGLALALIQGDNGSLGNFPISRVVTVGTNHRDVVIASDIVTGLFNRLPLPAAHGRSPVTTDLRYEHESIPFAELRGDDRSSVAFLLTMGRILEGCFAAQDTIHIGVTSGRSGMGAMAALAAGIYGAEYLWHFWVSEDIEEHGRLDKLPKPVRLDDNKYVNPTLAPEEYQVVPLPFLNLRPYHPILRRYFREYRSALEEGRPPNMPDDVSPLIQLLDRFGVGQLEEVFPAEFPVAAASKLIEMIGEYPNLSAQEKEIRRSRLLEMLGEYKVVERDETRQRLMKLLETGASDAQLLDTVVSSEPDGRFSQWWRDNQSSINTVSTVSNVLLVAVQVYLQAHGLC